METKFQTSFIPKKSLATPSVSHSKTSMGFFMFFALIIFMISVGIAGGAYGWKKYIEKRVIRMDEDLKANESKFEPRTIDEYYRLEQRMNNAKKLIDSHISMSVFFKVLGKLTLKSVQFKDLKYNLEDDGNISIEMNGSVATYNALADQSRVFGAEKRITNQVFSDIDVEKTGRVVFSFKGTINPELLYYKNNLPNPKDNSKPSELEVEEASAVIDAPRATSTATTTKRTATSTNRIAN